MCLELGLLLVMLWKYEFGGRNINGSVMIICVWEKYYYCSIMIICVWKKSYDFSVIITCVWGKGF